MNPFLSNAEEVTLLSLSLQLELSSLAQSSVKLVLYQEKQSKMSLELKQCWSTFTHPPDYIIMF